MASAAAVSPAAAVVGARRDERATTTRRCGDELRCVDARRWFRSCFLRARAPREIHARRARQCGVEPAEVVVLVQTRAKNLCRRRERGE